MIIHRLGLNCDFPFCYAEFEDITRKIGELMKRAEARGWKTVNGMHLCGPFDKSPDSTRYSSAHFKWENHVAVATNHPHQPDLKSLGRARFQARCVCNWTDDPLYILGQTRSQALNRWNFYHFKNVVKAERDAAREERTNG